MLLEGLFFNDFKTRFLRWIRFEKTEFDTHIDLFWKNKKSDFLVIFFVHMKSFALANYDFSGKV